MSYALITACHTLFYNYLIVHLPYHLGIPRGKELILLIFCNPSSVQDLQNNKTFFKK